MRRVTLYNMVYIQCRYVYAVPSKIILFLLAENHSNTLNLEVDEIQKQKTTSSSNPVSHEQESGAFIGIDMICFAF